MSRRHRGRPHHGRNRSDGPRPETARPSSGPDAIAPSPPASSSTHVAPVETTPAAVDAVPGNGAPSHVNGSPHASGSTTANGSNGDAHVNGHGTALTNGAATNGGGYANGNGHANGNERSAGCTAPQLRRFIKSRPYVPMHELRRRFAIDGNDDDVTPVELEGSKVYVGLPAREGSLLGELLRGGEIGYELSFDPLAPIVVGVYPMRPVPRS